MRRNPAAPASARPGAREGLNAADPGVQLLVRRLHGVPAPAMLLVCTGLLPEVRAGAPRLILDVRERQDDPDRAIPLSLEAEELDPEIRANLRVAAVWPRAHLGKDFSQQCLARSGLLLPVGAEVLCSVRKQKGADTLADFMGALFGNVRVLAKHKGYRLLRSAVDDSFDEGAAHELVHRRYVIEDETLGELSLQSAPGVFSRRELDAGTRSLLQHAGTLAVQPRLVLDLGCGVGPLCLWAMRRYPSATAIAIDTNVLAVQLCRANAARHGLSERLEVLWADGLPANDPRSGQADLALINPPTHADELALRELLTPLATWLRPGARALLVVSRPHAITGLMEELGATVEVTPTDRHHIVQARFE